MKICILSRQVDRLRESCTVIKFSRKEGSHASRPCVTSTALVRRFASDGQVFCRQWQKTHFAPRAHRTAVMRITRRSTFRQRHTFAHTCAHAASRSFAGKLHRYKILAQGRLPSASALNLLLATYGERVSRRVLYCCENSGGERKHIVRHLCCAMGCLSISRHCRTAALAKKISQKDFLRRGAASVVSVGVGCAEPPAVCAPPRRRQFKKNFVNHFTSSPERRSRGAPVRSSTP